MIPAGIFYALLAMLGWGFADFVAKLALKKQSHYSLLLLTQIFGLAALLLFYQIVPIPSDVPFFVLLGALWVFPYLSFYKGLKVGKLSIVSPIAASWAVVSSLIGILVFREFLLLHQLFGVMVTLGGVILISTSFSELRRIKRMKILSGVTYAIMAMLGWGLFYPLLNLSVSSLGIIRSVIYVRFFSVILLLLVVPWTSKRTHLNFSGWKYPLLIGIVDVLAFLASASSLKTEYVSVASPIMATFPLVSIVLAHLKLGERIELNQKIGAVFILLGLALLTIKNL